jgi:glycosyltransferase involved in cell wall biosynthesis
LQAPVAAREILVIDGASTDHTLGILKSYAEKIQWVSEADSGVYEAMNKGIRLARGRYLYFLGAGDRLRENVLSQVASQARLFESDAPQFVYGNVSWKDFNEAYDGEFTASKLVHCNICHQAIFYHRAIFERLGPFQTEYRCCADWVVNMKCFSDAGITKLFLPLTIADYEGAGQSTTEPDTAFDAARASLIKKYLETPCP